MKVYKDKKILTLNKKLAKKISVLIKEIQDYREKTKKSNFGTY